MSKSVPCWTEQVDGQAVQVMRPSARNDHILLGSRQFVKTVALGDAGGLSSIRSMKSTTATTAIAFHPLGESIIASGGSNGEVSIWYYGAQNIAPLNEKWAAHSRAIHALEFLPLPHNRATRQTLPWYLERDSAMLLTVSADGELNCWDVCSYSGKKETWRKPALIGNIRGEGLRCGLRDLDVRLTLNGSAYEAIVACDDGSIEYYRSLTLNPETVELKAKVSVSTQTINSCKFNGSSPLIATGGKDSYIRVFSLDSDTCVVSPVCAIRCLSSVWAVRWRPSGEFIAACQSIMDASINVWDLQSRLMPAYIFNSHRDNVTDFFWVDNFHVISCSRDNTVQLHAIKQAIIPIEKMRTVNITFTLHPHTADQTITSVCDVVNREKFETEHADIHTDEIKAHGFQSVSYTTASPTSNAVTKCIRNIKIKSVPCFPGFSLSPAYIAGTARLATQFIRDVSIQTEPTAVAALCERFSKVLVQEGGKQLVSHSECVRLIGWMLVHPSPGLLRQYIRKALQVYQEMNDIITVLVVGAVALFAADHSVAQLVDQKKYYRWCRSLLDVLRKLGLSQLAAEFVFFSPIADVRSISHSRTSIIVACPSCKREQELASATCSKCSNRLSECSLCGEQVKGLWVACQGCGHGGHVKHLDEWFKHYSVCPVPDCGHACR